MCPWQHAMSEEQLAGLHQRNVKTFNRILKLLNTYKGFSLYNMFETLIKNILQGIKVSKMIRHAWLYKTYVLRQNTTTKSQNHTERVHTSLYYKTEYTETPFDEGFRSYE